ncbi:MAG: hypothetical protein WEC00_10525 [Dongiaceae bacterium]
MDADDPHAESGAAVTDAVLIASAASSPLIADLTAALRQRGIAVHIPAAPPAGKSYVVVALAHVAAGADLPASDRDGFADEVSAMIEPIFTGLRQAIGRMRETGGAIVTLLVGVAGRPDNDLLFEAVGGAVANLTRSAALHAGKSGYRIRVNFIRAGRSDAAAIASAADAIAWLGNDDAGFVTGVEIDLDRAAHHGR